MFLEMLVRGSASEIRKALFMEEVLNPVEIY